MSENSYIILRKKLGVWESDSFLKILEAMFTPQEADVCMELFTPATCAELSRRLDVEEGKMQEMLDNLIDRGMLTRGKTEYGFHTSLIAFHHDAVADTAPHEGPHRIPDNVKKMWGEFFREEWYKEWIERQDKSQAAGGRNLPISPSISAIERSPNVSFDDLLPEENFRKKIEDAKRRIIAPCGCRVVWGVCDYPLMTCFATFDRPRGEFYLNQPGRILKEYTLAETLDIAREAEEAGLVHWGDCFCCSCCCENLYPLTKEQRFDLMTPNRFAANVDEEKCVGCQICIERCPFDAIEMRKGSSSKKYKAYVNLEKCKGCGVCIPTCNKNAITYMIVRPPEYVTSQRPPEPSPGKPVRTVPVWGFYELK
jgi:ferredoxin